MKKLFILLFTIALILPLYAQETDPNEKNALDESMKHRNITDNNGAPADEGPYEKQDTKFAENLSPPANKPFNFARQHFELGFDVGVGLDNGLMAMNEIFQTNIVIDMSKLASDISKDGAGFNTDIGGDFFINVMNIPIGGGIWDFGVSGGADGGINYNMPQSLFKLIAEGNKNQRSSSGIISASGGIYGDAGLSVSAQYENLKVGIRPAIYTPLVFIPKSGIKYYLKIEETEDDAKLSLGAEGGIIIYSPFMGGSDLQFGSDLSLEGEYALFTFLDVGGSLSHIPLAAAQVENGKQLTLDGLHYEIGFNSDNNGQDSPKFDFETRDYKGRPIKVFRPLCFDVYARYKPLNTEFVVVKPNLGFSVDTNEQEGYFNAGLEGQINLQDVFILHLGTGCQEGLWKHRFGFALNLRAFELDLEASLRSQNFVGSWAGQGFGVDIGMRFGW